MGYTHYWKATKVDAKEYKAALMDIAKIVKDQKAILAGPNGEPKTRPITNDGISFNGIDEDSHETFDLPAAGLKKFDFCKTARKPYDTVVTACLARLAEVKGVKVSSDGNMDEWKAGVALAVKVLNRPVVNPLGPKLAEAGFLGKVTAKYMKVVGTKSNTELAKAYYAACYDGLKGQEEGRLRSVSVYQNGDKFHASSSGVNGMGDEVDKNLDISDFGSHMNLDDMTKEEFVDMGMECFGIPDFLEQK